MYKQASKQSLRFRTVKGPLSVEQLWDLSLTQLDSLAVSLETAYKKAGKKSFLDTKTSEDKIAKLRFDIVLDVLNTKVEERDVAATKAGKRERNQQLLELIQKKQDEKLAGKSVEELTAMLEEE